MVFYETLKTRSLYKKLSYEAPVQRLGCEKVLVFKNKTYPLNWCFRIKVLYVFNVNNKYIILRFYKIVYTFIVF